MKNAYCCFAILVLLCAFQTSLGAQKVATWKGGTPGKSTDWNCATNWKEGRVPNEFSNVIIPDVSTSTFSNPVIDGDVEVFSLLCVASAHLTVLQKASLSVLQQANEETNVRNEGFSQIGSQLGYAVLPRK